MPAFAQAFFLCFLGSCPKQWSSIVGKTLSCADTDFLEWLNIF